MSKPFGRGSNAPMTESKKDEEKSYAEDQTQPKMLMRNSFGGDPPTEDESLNYVKLVYSTSSHTVRGIAECLRSVDDHITETGGLDKKVRIKISLLSKLS